MEINRIEQKTIMAEAVERVSMRCDKIRDLIFDAQGALIEYGKWEQKIEEAQNLALELHTVLGNFRREIRNSYL